jgi:hypothetical protein
VAGGYLALDSRRSSQCQACSKVAGALRRQCCGLSVPFLSRWRLGSAKGVTPIIQQSLWLSVIYFSVSLKPARKLSPMNFAIGPRSAAVPHGLGLPTRSQSSRYCNPHRLNLPTRSRSSRPCSPHGLHVSRGSTSLRACSPHGLHVPGGSTSLHARSPRPYGLPDLVPHLLWLYRIMWT